MSETEIVRLFDITRTTVRYRRTSSFELLKRYLEERALLPYPVIIAATKGDPQAMSIVVQQYESYIASLSMRKLRDERGNTYYGIDEDIRDRLRHGFP